MAGNPQNNEKLNTTLEKVCNILQTEGVNDWFIFHGTLLGIVREDSCIEGDDDLDIVINCEYSAIIALFSKYDFEFERKGFGRKFRDSKLILKTKPTDLLSSVDFYIAEVNQEGLFNVKWGQHTISNCYVDSSKKNFVEKKWKSAIIHLPNDYENKLVSMYGDWKTPGPGKVPFGHDI